MLLAFWQPLYAIEDVEQVRTIVHRMKEANRQLDYRGIFTYEHAGILKTIRVFHAVRDGVEFERLSHLNGPAREIFRQTPTGNCDANSPLSSTGSIDTEDIMDGNLEAHYNLYLRDRDRIAGRPVRVVNLVPRDNFRYGFVLAVDEDSGLLLQSLLIGGENRVLERFQFVDLELISKLDEAEFLPANANQETLVAEAKTCPDPDSSAPAEGQGLSWTAEWIPPGFALLGYRPLEDKQPATTRLYTDGMAEFTVFVDAGSAENLPPVHARRGATVAYLSRASSAGEDYAVCVVGEIPLATAQRIAESVNLTSPR